MEATGAMLKETNSKTEFAPKNESETSNNTKYNSRVRVALGTAVLGVAILASFLDLWFNLVGTTGLSVHHAELSLDNSASAEATLSVQGTMKSRSFLHTMSIDDSSCLVMYSQNGVESWHDLGNIRTTVNKKSNDNIEVLLSYKDVKFSSLRHLLYASYWEMSSGASINCHTGVTFYMYHAIPVQLKFDLFASLMTPTPGTTFVQYSSSGIYGTNMFKYSANYELHSNADNSNTAVAAVKSIMQSMKALIKILNPIIDLIKKDAKHIYSGHLQIDSSVHNPLPNGGADLSLDSFIVKVPALSFAFTSLADIEHEGRYVLSSTPFQVQLVDPLLTIATMVSLQCTDSFSRNNTSEDLALHSCNLVEGSKLQVLYNALMHGRINMAADSVQSNFLSALIGSQHTLVASPSDSKTVDAIVSNRLSQYTSGDSSNSGSSSSSSSRGLVSATDSLSSSSFEQHQDPRISTGGKCMIATADNVYDTYTCTVVEKGFIKLYLYLFDESGVLSSIELLNSWAETAPFAAATKATVLVRGGYYGDFNSTVSEQFQNATLSFRFLESNDVKIISEMTAEWDLNDAASSGSINYKGLIASYFSDTEEVFLETDIVYGDNAYSTELLSYYNVSSISTSFRALADGGYGGELLNWWLSVDDSSVYYNQDKEGDAVAYISSDVTNTGDAASMGLYLKANDGNEVEQLFTNNTLSWATSSVWTSAGNILLNSVLRLAGSSVEWNANGEFSYGDNKYAVKASDYSTSGETMLYLDGNGQYGGTWNSWWANLLDSYLIFDSTDEGHAVGSISAITSSSGDAADIKFYALATDTSSNEQLFTNSTVQWSSDSVWTSAGSILANSVLRVVDSINWNAYGLFNYGDHEYYVEASDYSLTDRTLLYVNGTGGYGGSWNDWWATLISSNLVVDEVTKGHAIGAIGFADRDNAESVDVYLSTLITDAYYTEQLFTNNSVAWYSPTSSWTNAGDITTHTQTRINSGADWDANFKFHYDNGAYSVFINDLSIDRSELFLTEGNGVYSSNSNSWYFTVNESYAYINGQKQGDANGILSAVHDHSYKNVTYLAMILVNDGSEKELFYTNDEIVWLAEYNDSSSSELIAAAGAVYTETRLSGDDLFYLLSEVEVDLVQETAQFMAVNTLYGEDKLNTSASAFYDMKYGMLTGIDAQVTYEQDLLFQAHTFWGLQSKTADLTPTVAPTVSPTVFPTVAPTTSPTFSPGSPTPVPTIVPTAVPTEMPSLVPTALPTISRAPTRSPTAFSPVLSFYSSITMSGVSSSSLDTASQTAVVNVTAASMGIDVASSSGSINGVRYDNYVVVSSTTTSAGTVASYARPYLLRRVATNSVSYTIIFTTYTTMKMSSTSYSSDELYSDLTTKLDTAVSSGSFTSDLAKVSATLGSTVFASVNVSSVNNSAATIAYVDDSDDDTSDTLSTGAIVGIVIGAVAFVLLCTAAIYYFVVYNKTASAATAATPSDTIQSHVIDNPVIISSADITSTDAMTSSLPVNK